MLDDVGNFIALTQAKRRSDGLRDRRLRLARELARDHALKVRIVLTISKLPILSGSWPEGWTAMEGAGT